jgi:N-acetylglucosaminyl-diphospho-decaprenol L-rhamnosyltransferase
MTDCTIVIPTRDRHDELARTLALVGNLSLEGRADVVVIDNASSTPAQTPAELTNGTRVRTIRVESNLGAAARNLGARESDAPWLLMLDDDSAPLDARFLDVCAHAAPEVGAIGADIRLPDGSRERGGLPEVIVGCGALVRCDAFLDVGGYDETFGYYAEEYDLCARLLMRGLRVGYDPRFRVEHRKVTAGRDMGAILYRITRNSAWVELRYAPDRLRDGMVEHVLERYEAIARREHAWNGYERAVREVAETYDAQRRTPMSLELYDRFTGLAHARSALHASRAQLDGARVALAMAGKQAWAVERALAELSLTGPGCDLVRDEQRAQALVVGTLSPGPMFDAMDALAGSSRPVVSPWTPGLAPSAEPVVERRTVAA